MKSGLWGAADCCDGHSLDTQTSQVGDDRPGVQLLRLPEDGPADDGKREHAGECRGECNLCPCRRKGVWKNLVAVEWKRRRRRRRRADTRSWLVGLIPIPLAGHGERRRWDCSQAFFSQRYLPGPHRPLAGARQQRRAVKERTRACRSSPAFFNPPAHLSSPCMLIE